MQSIFPTSLASTTRYCACAAFFLLILQFGVSQHSDEYFSVNPTPALRLIDQVLLVNSNVRNGTQGRFLNVRPSIGILTSTARTFIQDGATTEYATQVLGTTLEDGRLYAQLLKKSSRILYDHENGIAPSHHSSGTVRTSIVGEIPLYQYIEPKSLLQSHNDLVADKDWQDIDDSLIHANNSFVGNTNVIRIDTIQSDNIGRLHKNDSREPPRQSISSGNVYEINAHKIKLPMDLSTVTIKNIFSPSGHSWESLDDKLTINSPTTSRTFSRERSPKLLHREIMKKDYRPLSTVTYYGFADFTTIVGDSVIVFSPSTSSDMSWLKYVTSITGAATLGVLDSSYITNVRASANQNVIEPTFISESESVSMVSIKPNYRDEKNIGKLESSGKEEVVALQTKASYHVTAPFPVDVDVVESQRPTATEKFFTEEIDGNTTPFSSKEHDFPTTVIPVTEDDLYNVDRIILSSSMSDVTLTRAIVTPQYTSEVNESLAMFTKPSNEEILMIYSSLAEKADRNQTIAKMNLSEDIKPNGQVNLASIKETSGTESNTQIQGGATTIFFEDDPFLDFLPPSTTDDVLQTTTQSTSTINGEGNVQASIMAEIPVVTAEEKLIENSETEYVTEGNTERKLNIEVKEEGIRNSNVYFHPIVKEIAEDEQIEGCSRTSQVFLTQIPKTITLVKPVNVSETSTLFETNVIPSFEISEATKYYCIQSTPASHIMEHTDAPVIERPIKPEISDMENNANEESHDNDLEIETTTYMTVSEEVTETTESGYDHLQTNYADEDESDAQGLENEQDSDEEVEIIYKTLYTTFTYLTTFFQASTTNVSSRKKIVTNVVTSSLGASSESSREQTLTEPSMFIETTGLIGSTLASGIRRPIVQSSDLQMIDGILKKKSDSIDQVKLSDLSNLIKTTYTYYTTIFVDGETEIMSRTEIYTNILGTQTASGISSAVKSLDIGYTAFDDDNAVIDIQPTSTHDAMLGATISWDIKENDTEIVRHHLEYKTINRVAQNIQSASTNPVSQKVENTIADDGDLVRLFTAVQSSSSNGHNQIIENGIFDDQISSESNTDEILPSATLLLQTSFTTFTYYTTMYSSDVVSVMSRLETITNVATETLQPTKTIDVEVATLPLTYFTTFTYWTKLTKEGEIATLSHEETVSNVLTPTVSHSIDNQIGTTSIPSSQVMNGSATSTQSELETAAPQLDIEPTTYYTTFTYYTTSYAGDITITNSRFETVSNIVQSSRLSAELNIKPESTIVTTSPNVATFPRTLAYDYKTIVDGISTLYYNSELLATLVDGISTEVELSTSRINIDEIRKTISETKPADEKESTRTYRTGLVRLIKGSKLLNETTTVYQSKVIGTIIDNRYAQIIESTSSFIIKKTEPPTLTEDIEIQVTSTLSPHLNGNTHITESSISDNVEEPYDTQEDYNTDNENEQSVSRSSFPLKKKTFSPVIRPFASRYRPQFAPKGKIIQPSSATIITRSDLTPTITATPALKSESRNRFGSSRKTSSGGTAAVFGGSNTLGNKRFGRPSKTIQALPTGSSNFPGSPRSRLQASKIQSSSNFGGFQSSRRSGFRSSSTNIYPFASASGGSSRLRIRPSSSSLYENPQTLLSNSGEDSSIENDDSEEETEITTESTRRNNNPLLRLRRPPVNRLLFTSNQHRNPATPKPKTLPVSTTTTTVRPRPRAFRRPAIGQLPGRPRLQSNLFPPRHLPAQSSNQALDNYQKNPDDSSENADEETDLNSFEEEQIIGEDDNDDNRRRRESYSIFLKNRRSKRQADFSVRNNFRNRFRRPSTAKTTLEGKAENLAEEESSTAKPRTSGSFTPRTHTAPASTYSGTRNNKSQGSSRAIRPTKPNVGSRAQFTLREKDTTLKHQPRSMANFKRPGINGISSRRTSATPSRPKAPRLKNFGSSVTETTHSGLRSRSSTSRARSTPRGRSRNDFTTDQNIPTFDGSITVTHTTPIEITIPVINGKVTEYKNVLTTTTSTQVLSYDQYTSIIGSDRVSTLVLNKEDSTVGQNGVTEITQFILRESPIKATIFTPTTIRGRKTSFAHVIPSTAYLVENIVSTVQPNLLANAPLANILLSQLLLGNIGLNQPNLNPLLALGATQQISQTPGSPATEYKTRTSTYVTTVTNEMSTVIPLTFHGKEVLTTIFESSSNVITATEYFTETIVITQTQLAQAQQVNSLLLPLLLQQQLQGQPEAQNILPLQTTMQAHAQFSDNLQDLDNTGGQKYNDYGHDLEDYATIKDELIEASQNAHSIKKGKNNRGRKHNRQPTTPAQAHESSVITLYVSGRRPGEFSTVLSTVQVGGESTLHKREAFRSNTANYDDFYKSDGSEVHEYLLPASNDVTSSHSLREYFLPGETQSLESIVGDVDLWYAKTSVQLEPPLNKDRSTINQFIQTRANLKTGHQPYQQTTSSVYVILSQHKAARKTLPLNSISSVYSNLNKTDLIESTTRTRLKNNINYQSLENFDEARHNLATRIMSNGVEVIIAGDKNEKVASRPNILRIVPNFTSKPMTLAPSTLKDQMVLVVPSNKQENNTIPVNSNHFITKICLTTYTHRITYLQDYLTSIESLEQVVPNTATEERSNVGITPTDSLNLTLTPESAVEIFPYTYTYLNTVLDGDLPVVVPSHHTLTNAIAGPDDYISFLQPSEAMTPILESNTYFSDISLTGTLKESNISTSNTLSRIIMKESLPPRNITAMTSYTATDTVENGQQFLSNEWESSNQMTGRNQSKHEIHSAIKNSHMRDLEKTNHLSIKDRETKLFIYATKTYLTTLTYLTSFNNPKSNNTSSTVVNLHTRIIENVVTESDPSSLIGAPHIAKLSDLKTRNSYISIMTLPKSQSLEITAMNIIYPSVTLDKSQTDIDSAINEQLLTTTAESSFQIIPNTDFDENSNETLDPAFAGSENEEFFTKHYINPESSSNINTETQSDLPPVNNLIGSFSFHRLQALGPVFQAMAGLIQNNFGTSLESKIFKKQLSNTHTENEHSPSHTSPIDVTQIQSGPIYIPVHVQDDQQNEDFKNLKLQNSLTSYSSYVLLPKPDWLINEKANTNEKIELIPLRSVYETALLNRAITISPGEVITANSDVIIGKPNGIEPRVTFNKINPTAVEITLKPPPSAQFSYRNKMPTKHDFRHIPLKQTFDKELRFDGILTPKSVLHPMLPQYQQHDVKKTALHHISNMNYKSYYTNGLTRKPMQSHKQQMHLSQQLPKVQTKFHQRPYPSQGLLSRLHQAHPRPMYSPQQITQKPIYIPYTPYEYKQPQTNQSDTGQVVSHNEILEIKRIPEIYSTNLPGTNLESVNSSNGYGNALYQTHINNSLVTEKYLLVNIQPSQITSIVIPHEGTTSLLLANDGVELHRNGQYYDEPNLFYHKPPVRKRISSNQQINLDMNVLSHNIDINVPPITFNKETDFPDSQPVRGHIQNNEKMQYQISHVTIPITDNQIQVNLTPQNIVTTSLSPKYSIDKNLLTKSYIAVEESPPSVEPAKYSNSATRKNSTQKIVETLTPTPVLTRVSSNSLLPVHQYISTYFHTTTQMATTSNQPIYHGSSQKVPENNGIKPIILPPPYNTQYEDIDDLSGEFSQDLPSPLKGAESFWQSYSSHHINRDKNLNAKQVFTEAKEPTTNKKNRTKAFQVTQNTNPIITTFEMIRKPVKTTNVPQNKLETISILDQANANAVNGMRDLEISSIPPLSLVRRPFPGKAFIPLYTTTAKPAEIKPDINIVLNPGQGFELQIEKTGHKSKVTKDNLKSSQKNDQFVPDVMVIMPSKIQKQPSELNQLPSTNQTKTIKTTHEHKTVKESTEIIESDESMNTLQRDSVYLTGDTTNVNVTSDDWPNVKQRQQEIISHISMPATTLSIQLPSALSDKQLNKIQNKHVYESPLNLIINTFNTHPQTIRTRPSSKQNVSKFQKAIQPTTLMKDRTPFSSSMMPAVDEIVSSFSLTDVNYKMDPLPEEKLQSSIANNSFLKTHNTPIGFQQRYKYDTNLKPPNESFDKMLIITLDTKMTNDITIQGSEQNYRHQTDSILPSHQTLKVIPSSRQNPSKMKPNASSRLRVPTKSITNNHILTVAITKTNVLTSMGNPPSTSTTLLQSAGVVESRTTTHMPITYSPMSSNQTAESIGHLKTSKKPDEQLTSNANFSTERSSIFVVLSSKKNHGGMSNTNLATIDASDNATLIGNGTLSVNDEDLIYESDIGFGLASRGEDNDENKVNHVILGGVLIATAPKVNDNSINPSPSSCVPTCKASRHEICQHVENRMECTCRPGFARMFPDRACRPTYTYNLDIPIYQVNKQLVHFEGKYHSKDSDEFQHISTVIHDAVDRMIKQSDLRDAYHGVHLFSLDKTKTDNGILGRFFIQLSDNSNEKRLVDILKKYLRQNNYSLGGTDIYTSVNGLNTLEISDFDECVNDQFHDCSENSRCFNLQGSYTCSCREGYADLSENTIYPGRICSSEVIGCERCYYHGKCNQVDNSSFPVCECFHWYIGASCQLNLKILLIALISLGTILMILLLFCILAAYTRRKNNENLLALVPGIRIIAPKTYQLSAKNTSTDKRAMIKYSSSETSDNSIPYVLQSSVKRVVRTKKGNEDQHMPRQKFLPFKNTNQCGHPHSGRVQSISKTISRPIYSEQSDRSLTVMIPRAKYYHSVITQPVCVENSDQAASVEIASMLQTKAEKGVSQVSLLGSNHPDKHTTSRGALVSSGLEVSATVGGAVTKHVDDSSFSEPHIQCKTFNSMDSWLNTLKGHELTSEVRSFDETTVQAHTKPIPVEYEKQFLQHNGHDEANPMAERDVGSTFLLPHTHLYKSDRDSDISGFESF